MADLKTDYKDDVLDTSVNSKRTFNIVDQDGNIIFENVTLNDTTVYSQIGDSFGALDINSTNEAIEQVNSDLGSATDYIGKTGNVTNGKWIDGSVTSLETAIDSMDAGATKVFYYLPSDVDRQYGLMHTGWGHMQCHKVSDAHVQLEWTRIGGKKRYYKFKNGGTWDSKWYPIESLITCEYALKSDLTDFVIVKRTSVTVSLPANTALENTKISAPTVSGYKAISNSVAYINRGTCTTTHLTLATIGIANGNDVAVDATAYIDWIMIRDI